MFCKLRIKKKESSLERSVIREFYKLTILMNTQLLNKVICIHSICKKKMDFGFSFKFNVVYYAMYDGYYYFNYKEHKFLVNIYKKKSN